MHLGTRFLGVTRSYWSACVYCLKWRAKDTANGQVGRVDGRNGKVRCDLRVGRRQTRGAGRCEEGQLRAEGAVTAMGGGGGCWRRHGRVARPHAGGVLEIDKASVRGRPSPTSRRPRAPLDSTRASDDGGVNDGTEAGQAAGDSTRQMSAPKTRALRFAEWRGERAGRECLG